MADTTMPWVDLSAYQLQLALASLDGMPQYVVIGTPEALAQSKAALDTLGFKPRGQHVYLESLHDLPAFAAWEGVLPKAVIDYAKSPRDIAKDKASALFMVKLKWVDPKGFAVPAVPQASEPEPEPEPEPEQAQETAPKNTLRWLDLSSYGLSISYRSVGDTGELGQGDMAIAVVGSKSSEQAYARIFEELGATVDLDRESGTHARIIFNEGFSPETLEAIQQAMPLAESKEMPRAEVVVGTADNPFAAWESLDQIDWADYRNQLAREVVTRSASDTPQPFTEDQLRDQLAKSAALPPELVTREAGISGRLLQESIEAACSQGLRVVAKRFDNIAPLINRAANIDALMPRDTVKSSTSLLLQQYSTPLAISVVMQDILGIDESSTVWEPTAGNGSLVSLASPDLVGGFELDSDRLSRLHEQGFTNIRHADATRNDVPDGKYDKFVANPPFGAFSDGKGGRMIESFVPFEPGGNEYPAMKLSQQDQYIALRNLKAMHPKGTGAIILGADHPMNYKAGEISEKTRNFLRMLNDTHDVIGTHYVDGGLYKSHGAGWPLILIVTGGRREAAIEATVPEKLPVISTHEDLITYHATMKEEVDKWQRDNDPIRKREKNNDGSNSQSPDSTDSDKEEKDTESPETDLAATAIPEEEEEVEQEFETADLSDVDWDQLEAMEDEALDNEHMKAQHAVEDAEVPYLPRSRMPSLNKMIPANLAVAVSQALDNVQLQHGEIDSFVADELGWTLEELEERLAAEQVDAMALSIYQAKMGKGFILGDNTGIGKGRVVAAMMVWGIKNGHKPVFVTAKAGLFVDIMRDLRDIGSDHLLKPLVMNDIPVVKDADGTVIIKNTPAKDLKPLLKERTIGKDHNSVFMTYSQINLEMGKCEKAQWLTAIAEDNVLLFDEAHLASGASSNTGQNVKEAIRAAKYTMYASGTPIKRVVVGDDSLGAYIATSMFDGSDHETLVATIAAGGDSYREFLANELARSGQMIVRSHPEAPSPEPVLLSGEYDGLDVREISDRLATVLDAMTGLSEGAEAIVNEENDEIKAVLEAMHESERPKFQHWKSSTVNFGSIRHNIVRQAVLAMKAEGAAQAAIQDIRSGKRVVAGFDNTMESFLEFAIDSVRKEIAANDAAGADHGDGEQADNTVDITPEKLKAVPANIGYRDAIRRLMDRLIVIESTDRYGETTMNPAFDVKEKRVSWEDGSLMERLAMGKPLEGDHLAHLYFETEEHIYKLPEGLPASPIDYIRNRIEQAGIKTVEVTGRSLRIDYSDEESPVFARRDSKDRDRKLAEERFNNGDAQYLILNASGGTGSSYHAHKDFKNTEDRVFHAVQQLQNPADLIQMMGRIHRSGAVEGYTPSFKIFGLPLIAELAAMSAVINKERQLRASSRGDREGKMVMFGEPMSNRVGDQVTLEVLRDYPDSKKLCKRLGIDLEKERKQFSSVSFEQGIGSDTKLYHKTASRFCMLHLAQAEPLNEALQEAYLQRIEQLDRTGSNPLKTKILDLRAQMMAEEYEVVPKFGPSSFQDPVIARKIRFKQEVNPISFSAVESMLDSSRQRLKKVGASEMPMQEKWEEINTKQLREAGRQAKSRCKEFFESLGSDEMEAADKFIHTAITTPGKLRVKDEDRDIITNMARRHTLMKHFRDKIGLGIKVSRVPPEALGGEEIEGVPQAEFVITSVRPPKPTDNPAAPSSWGVTLTSPEGKVGAWRVSLSQLMTVVHENPSIMFGNDPLTPEALKALFNDDREAYVVDREKVVLTRNLISAVAAAKQAQEMNPHLGRFTPAVYTDEDGHKTLAVMAPDNFSLDKLDLLMDVDFTISKPDVAMAYLNHAISANEQDDSQNVQLYSSNAWYSVSGARANDKVDTLGAGIHLKRDKDSREWVMSISAKKKDNRDFLKDGVLMELFKSDFETSTEYRKQNMMTASLRSNALLPELIQRLVTHHQLSFHGSHKHSDWHRDYLRQRGEKLQQEEDELKAQLATATNESDPNVPGKEARATDFATELASGLMSRDQKRVSSNMSL
ncbi:strawberry notch C-terminal domain-containing protein [Vreelandella rituensis]|uniref:Helicase ATP-binding domain-containing protein n=1 Tax=Vreelandella rituensis TaxID=2282306 RepID=A0A368U928_9GAMM|nr:strawberry notch C-terminal domain-containing protein [Halomonas rituensis]RCV93709.1 hypothetical protein DU506_00720 [Halomonas rituensis]